MKARCGSVWGAVVFLAMVVCPWARAGAFNPGEWTEPTSLTEVNSHYDDKAPFLSFDGLKLYFARSSAWRYAEIYEATRATLDEPFGEPSQIAGLNSPYANVDCPWVSRDNLRMYYYSTESSWRRLRMARRSSIGSWRRVGSEIAELNSLGEVANPSLTEDELTIVFSGLDLWDGKGGWDLWTADRPNRNAPFGNVANLGIVNSGYWDMHPCITPDGLTLYFASNRNGVFQIFESMRPSLNSRFGPPAHIAVLDIPDTGVQYPHLSADGKMFLFGRWKNDESMDICVSYKVDLNVRGVKLVRGGDAGDPAADFSREPVPHGGRVNIGAHGGTAFAEMSELPVSSDVNGDGVADVNDLELFLDLWEQQSQSKPPVGR